MTKKINRRILIFFIIAALLLISLQNITGYNDISKSYYPKAVSAPTNLYVIDQSNLSGSLGTMIATLQGLVAKNRPQIYIQTGNGYNTWLSDLQANYGVITTTVTDPWFLVDQFKPGITGYILFQNGDSSINAATSLAGVLNAVAVESGLQSTASAHGLSLVLDVRGKDELWVKNNYWTQLRHDLVIEQKESFLKELRDYGAMTSAMTMYDGNSTFRSAIMNSLDADSPSIGWGDASAGEDKFVGPSSSSGVFAIPADWAANLSTFSGVSIASLQQNPLPSPTPETNVHYVTFMMSDGDNVQWLLNDFSTSANWFGNSNRGTFNMGWGMSPAFFDLAPSVMKWYYQHASNGTYKDNFILMGGNGYTYYSQYPAAELDLDVARLNDYMGKTDLNTMCVIDNNAFNNAALWNKFTSQPNIEGIFYLEYSNYKAMGGAVNWSNGKPVIGCKELLWNGLSGCDNTTVINNLNAAPRTPSSTAGYTMVCVHAWSKTLSDVKTVINGLNSSVRVVPPDTFVRLMKQNVSLPTPTPVPTPTATPAGVLQTYQAETDFSHNCGRLDGEGWSCNVTQDAAGHMLYGPYTTAVPAGLHPVRYWIMIDNNTADNLRAVLLDVNDTSGGGVLAQMEVLRQQFTVTNSYQSFDLNVNFTAGHKMEFRVWYDDRAYIKVDRVEIIDKAPTPTPTLSPTPTPSATPTPTTTPIYNEAELLTVSGISSGDTHAVVNDNNLSGGQGGLFNGNAAGDYIQYTVNVAASGTYNIKVKVNKSANRGKYQLAIDGANQGTAFDSYAASSSYAEVDLGSVTFSTSGNKTFKFTCTGKKNTSTGYTLLTDYIKLTKL